MPLIGAIDGGGETPGTPTMGTATAGDTRASITFTPPSYIGKGSIVYTAVSSPGGITGSAGSSPVEVTGLTNGVSYTFTIYGTTDYGVQGGTSGVSNAVTPQAPVVCPAYGTLLAANQCSGTTKYNLRANGSCGSYQEILEYNSTFCGYTPPAPTCTQGAWTGDRFCQGQAEWRTYYNSNCTTYNQEYENQSTYCGYVPLPGCTCCVGVAVSDSCCMPPSRLYQRNGVSYNGSCGAAGGSGTNCSGACQGCSCPAFIDWGGWFFVQSGYCYPDGCTI